MRLDPTGLEITAENGGVTSNTRRSNRLRGLEGDDVAGGIVKAASEGDVDENSEQRVPLEKETRSGKYETIGGVEYKIVQRRQRSAFGRQRRRKRAFKLITYYVAPNGIEFTRDELCGEEEQDKTTNQLSRRSTRKQDGDRLKPVAEAELSDTSTVSHSRGNDDEKENLGRSKKSQSEQTRKRPRSLSPNSKLNIQASTTAKAESDEVTQNAGKHPRRVSPRNAKNNCEKVVGNLTAAREIDLSQPPKTVNPPAIFYDIITFVVGGYTH